MEVNSKLLPDEECLGLIKKGSDVIKFPYIWLRDNCLCEKCYNSVTLSRRTRLQDLQLDPKISNITQENGKIRITWSDDGHVSDFPVSWLIDHTLPTDKTAVTRKLRYRHTPELWGSELQQNVPEFNFQKLMKEDESLFDWIVTMDTVGVCIITSAPAEEGQLAELASRVIFLRPTQYGKTFHVRSKLQPSNVAFTTEALPLHTDNAYSHQPAGIQLLHCIKQAAEGHGGESTSSDGFYAASLLQKEHPEYYKLLTDTKIDIIDIGSDLLGPFHYIYHGPMFTLDCYGELERINFVNDGRDMGYMGDVTLEKVKDVYTALKKYDDIVRENSICFPLAPGDILVVDNRRVMHGRKAFTMSPDNERFLEGGYIDWDHLYSRMRVLAAKLNKY